MAADPVSVRTSFRPAEHGFPFGNWFPQGKPLWTFGAPLLRIRVGDASKGMCGGMVFAALDYQFAGRPVPGDPAVPSLHAFLARRLWNSFRVPWGPARIFEWMGRPDTAQTRSGTHPTATVPYLTTQREWPKVRATLDAGQAAPLMLILTSGRNPWAMGFNHQVLATGYDEDRSTADVTLHIYDPNHPGDDDVALRFNMGNYDGRRIAHTRDGETVRGFFLNRHRPVRPPV